MRSRGLGGLACALLALAACGKADDARRTATPRVPPPLPDVASISTNEPFWQARVDGGSLLLTGFSRPAHRYAVVRVATDAAGRHWTARDGASEVVASVAPLACLDSLSGAALPFVATLRIDGSTAGGCADVADADAAVEIPAAYSGRWAPGPLACDGSAVDPDRLVIEPRAIHLRGATVEPVAVVAPTLNRGDVTLRDGSGTIAATLLLDRSGRHLTLQGFGAPINRLRCQDP